MLQENGAGREGEMPFQQPPLAPAREAPIPTIATPRPLLAGVISHPVVEQLVDVLLIAAAHGAMKSNASPSDPSPQKETIANGTTDAEEKNSSAPAAEKQPGSTGVRDLSPSTASLLCEEQDVLNGSVPAEKTFKPQDTSWTSLSYAAQEQAVLTEFNHCLQKVVGLGKHRAAVWTQSVAHQQAQPPQLEQQQQHQQQKSPLKPASDTPSRQTSNP